MNENCAELTIEVIKRSFARLPLASVLNKFSVTIAFKNGPNTYSMIRGNNCSYKMALFGSKKISPYNNKHNNNKENIYAKLLQSLALTPLLDILAMN